MKKAVFAVLATTLCLLSASGCGDDTVGNGGGGNGNSNSSTFTDERDGQTYKTVKIGNQVWMAENLNYNAEGSKCYNNDEVNYAQYGRLYDWETAKKACPAGWHLPADSEWQTLIDFVGGKETAGKKLKSTAGWSESGNGTDNYGFAALPGGYGRDGVFYLAGYYGLWWGAEHEPPRAYCSRIPFDGETIATYYDFNTHLQSARCLQD